LGKNWPFLLGIPAIAIAVIGVVAVLNSTVRGAKGPGHPSPPPTTSAAAPSSWTLVPDWPTIPSQGPKSVSRSDVAQQITSRMTDAVGNKPDSVMCPSDLPANVGAQLNCTMKVKNQTFNVNVTVTSVNGSDVKFDMVETVDKAQVASVISDKLAQQVGRKPDSVTCPDNLKGVVGTTLRCQLSDAGEKYGIAVTVTNVDAGDVNFDFKVDDHPE
jgi:hypothetical protein